MEGWTGMEHRTGAIGEKKLYGRYLHAYTQR